MKPCDLCGRPKALGLSVEVDYDGRRIASLCLICALKVEAERDALAAQKKAL